MSNKTGNGVMRDKNNFWLLLVCYFEIVNAGLHVGEIVLIISHSFVAACFAWLFFVFEMRLLLAQKIEISEKKFRYNVIQELKKSGQQN